MDESVWKSHEALCERKQESKRASNDRLTRYKIKTIKGGGVLAGWIGSETPTSMARRYISSAFSREKGSADGRLLRYARASFTMLAGLPFFAARWFHLITAADTLINEYLMGCIDRFNRMHCLEKPDFKDEDLIGDLMHLLSSPLD